MNSSAVTPLQSRPWKNSFLSLPKKPSAAALSGLRPFLDIDRATPCRSHIAFQPGHR